MSQVVQRIELTERKPNRISIQNSCMNQTLSPLLKWMSCLGVSAPASDSAISASLACFIRDLINYLLILAFQFFFVVNNCLDIKTVAKLFAKTYSTEAVSWNFIIDTLNLAIYIIFNHSFLLFKTRTKAWKNLSDTFEMPEAVSSSFFDIDSKCRKTQAVLMSYVVFAV